MPVPRPIQVALTTLVTLAFAAATVVAVSAPAGAQTSSGWVEIGAGGSHVCALNGDGDVYCWGRATTGALGNGDELAPDQPSPNLVVDGHTWASVSTGTSHTCGVTDAGDAYCWGADGTGQLGNGATSGNQFSPSLVEGGHTWVSVAAGGNHTCGITDEGDAYCWGTDFRGKLGNGATSGNQVSPSLVEGGHAWVSLAAGGNHTCGITDEGDAYCWGTDGRGQLGNGPDLTDDQAAPSLVSGSHTWASMSAGNSHTCGVTDAGEARCWGNDAAGQLGNGPAPDQDSPAPVDTGDEDPQPTWAVVTTGSTHSCGITDAGDALCWGDDAFGRLGNGSDDGQDAPRPVAGEHEWVDISAGPRHGCGLTVAGPAYCWGDDGNMQLGNGEDATGDQHSPSRVGVSQAITFDPLDDRPLGSPAFTVAPTASSGLPVTVTAAGACSVAGDVVQLTAVGDCDLTATQPGDDLHLPGSEVQSFAVTPAPVTPVPDDGDPDDGDPDDGDPDEGEPDPIGPHGFVDVPPGAFFEPAVAWAAADGITTGTGDGSTFDPFGASTRAQVVTFLWRMAGSPDVPADHGFTDVPATAYSSTAVAWAADEGVTTGTGDGSTFSPGAPATRGQVVTFLWRMAGSPDAPLDHGFTDVPDDAFHSEAVAWAEDRDVTTGVTATTFEPLTDVTRGEFVVFLWRLAGEPT